MFAKMSTESAAFAFFFPAAILHLQSPHCEVIVVQANQAKQSLASHVSSA